MKILSLAHATAILMLMSSNHFAHADGANLNTDPRLPQRQEFELVSSQGIHFKRFGTLASQCVASPQIQNPEFGDSSVMRDAIQILNDTEFQKVFSGLSQDGIILGGYAFSANPAIAVIAPTQNWKPLQKFPLAATSQHIAADGEVQEMKEFSLVYLETPHQFRINAYFDSKSHGQGQAAISIPIACR